MTSKEPIGMSDAGKNVARRSILHSCVKRYATPAWTHFQNALYSALKNTTLKDDNDKFLFINL